MELEKCFENFGKLSDAYVPPIKRDSAGGLFGQMKNNFEKLSDAYVPIKRDSAGGLFRSGKPNSRLKGNNPLQNFGGPPPQFQENTGLGGGGGNKPYLDALLRSNEERLVVRVRDDADFDAVQWYDKSLVGKMKDINQLCHLQLSISKDMEKMVSRGFADRFIGGAPLSPIPIAIPNKPSIPGVSSNPIPLPDLNSHLMGFFPEESEEMVSSEYIADTCEQPIEDVRMQEDQVGQKEIVETLEIGKNLRVNFNNFEDMLRQAVEGELETSVIQ
ncbi:hypothetical protein L1987_16659 [Smallanthus sonchifolius]|uniref:Uncharacterized protein n=1 Tax=Smallanthus sonchifolius TaxID=185202 RepID=A0ACB9IWT9_9ASTR|nr:hypothetical protein L1987_16659 [Smallanthus sonchifolius]